MEASPSGRGGPAPAATVELSLPMEIDLAGTTALPADKPVATAYALGYMKALLAAAGG